MTIDEATNIADSALEHTVRTILASLQAPEILKSTAGKLFSLIQSFFADVPVSIRFHLRFAQTGSAVFMLACVGQ